VDNLIANIKGLPVPPDVATKLLAMALRLKDLGPIGDEMADLLAPDEQEQLPPQAMAALQQLKQQADALNAYAKQLESEINKLKQEKDAKIVDNQMKKEMVELQERTKILIAEINAKAQETKLRMEWEREQWLALHGSAHDLAMQKDAQGASAQQADADREAAAQAAEPQPGVQG
jgi:hypothetical protein